MPLISLNDKVTRFYDELEVSDYVKGGVDLSLYLILIINMMWITRFSLNWLIIPSQSTIVPPPFDFKLKLPDMPYACKHVLVFSYWSQIFTWNQDSKVGELGTMGGGHHFCTKSRSYGGTWH
jgi:hypothetical protein